MGATPFDPGVQESIKFGLGSNLLLAAPPYLIIRQVNRDGHRQTDGRLVVKLEWALEANLPSDWTYPSRTRVSGWQCLATAWLTATADGPTPSWCSVRWLQVHPNRHSPSPFSTAAKIWQAGSLRQARYGRETGFQLNRQPIAMMGYR